MSVEKEGGEQYSFKYCSDEKSNFLYVTQDKVLTMFHLLPFIAHKKIKDYLKNTSNNEYHEKLIETLNMSIDKVIKDPYKTIYKELHEANESQDKNYPTLINTCRNLFSNEIKIYFYHFSMYFDLIISDPSISDIKGGISMMNCIPRNILEKFSSVYVEKPEKVFETLNQKLNLATLSKLKKGGVGENNNLFLDEYFDNESIKMVYLDKNLINSETLYDLYENSEIILVYRDFSINNTKIYILTEVLTINYETIRKFYPENNSFFISNKITSFNRKSFYDFLIDFDYQYRLNYYHYSYYEFIECLKLKLKDAISLRRDIDDPNSKIIDEKIADNFTIFTQKYSTIHSDSDQVCTLMLGINDSKEFKEICRIDIRARLGQIYTEFDFNNKQVLIDINEDGVIIPQNLNFNCGMIYKDIEKRNKIFEYNSSIIVKRVIEMFGSIKYIDHKYYQLGE